MPPSPLEGQVGLAVLAVVLSAALLSMVVYRLRGRARDADADGKGAQLFLGFGDFLLHWFLWAVDPAVGVSVRLRLTPDFYNFAGLVLGILSGALIAQGNLQLGGWAIALGGVGTWQRTSENLLPELSAATALPDLRQWTEDPAALADVAARRDVGLARDLIEERSGR